MAPDRSRISFYDPHWRKPLGHGIDIDAVGFEFVNSELGAYDCNSNCFAVFDEYCATKLVYFIPKRHRVAVLKESPVLTRKMDCASLSKHFNLILTHRADLLQIGKPFSREDYCSSWVTPFEATNIAKEKTNIVSMIASIQHADNAGYKFRKEVVEHLKRSTSLNVQLFGNGVNPITSKNDALNSFCFTIVMENTREDFYYSEKLIDSIMCETIPIYWGCPSIHTLLNPRGILVFQTLEELDSILKNLSVDMYESMRSTCLENKKRLIEHKMDSFRSYFERIGQRIVDSNMIHKGRFHRWQFSKPMALTRYVVETMGGKLSI